MSMGEPRAAISPSHLTYAWGDCHRCLWLQYNHQVSVPVQMPLIGDLADMQEKYFIGAKTSDMHPDLPEGKVHSHGGWVASENIVVDGTDSGLYLRGKYDLLLEFVDGSFGIVDCKLQKNDYDKSNFYAPQLEAYAFSLEHPQKDEPKKISLTGLYTWSLDRASGNLKAGFGYRVNTAWYPAERNPVALQERLTELIRMIRGECPPSKDSCGACTYVAERREILGKG